MKLILTAAIMAPAAAFVPSAAFSARSSTILDANIVDTLAGLEGPGQVWGADGIAVGKEESDLKGYDNFGLFTERLASTGVAATLTGPGPYTVFAPTDTAIQSFEAMGGTITADTLKYSIVEGSIASSAVGSTPLNTLTGQAIAYSRKFRKDFVNDAIVGEKTFGPFADFPTDVQCDNGVIHSVGIFLDPADAAPGGAAPAAPAYAAAPAPAYAAAPAPAYAAPPAPAPAPAGAPAKGAGGMFDTRDPEAFVHEDPRKSIGAAPSFEEYLKSRDTGGAAPAAAAPAAAAPAPPAPAYAAPPAPAPAPTGAPAKGAGGMFDTRDPEAFQHEDPRKSIGEAPSFEEYLKSRGN